MLLLVQVLGLLLGLVLGLLAVEVVHALGLGQLVDLGGGEAGEHLLGELVLNGLAYMLRMRKLAMLLLLFFVSS